ncbi:MAG: putative secreted Zn-dependent protease [Phycisphaerales bacterium]|jgi:predicted secreted Zn-dependent protease
MGKPAINVKSKWGSKKTENSIRLKAKTLGGALEELEKLDEWGEFDGQIGFAYKAKSKKVTEVTLKPSYVIKMPVWAKYGGAPKGAKKEWDRMYKALEKHENIHRLLHLETYAIITDWLVKAEELTESDFKAQFKKLMTQGQKNQDKFDSSSDHGSKKGVELNIKPEWE